MLRDLFIKQILPVNMDITPTGRISDELSPEEFAPLAEQFFADILEISKADISELEGYGEFNDENKLESTTLRQFLMDEFAVEREGYWKNWTEIFETTMVPKEFFYKYHAKMLEYAPYCEGQRYLVNNNTFF